MPLAPLFQPVIGSRVSPAAEAKLNRQSRGQGSADNEPGASRQMQLVPQYMEGPVTSWPLFRWRPAEESNPEPPGPEPGALSS